MKIFLAELCEFFLGDTLAKIELLRTEFCPIPRVTPLDQPDGGRKVGGGLTASSANSRPDSRGPSPGGRSDTSSTASRGGRESTPPKQLSGGSTAKKKAPAPKPPVTKTKEVSFSNVLQLVNILGSVWPFL